MRYKYFYRNFFYSTRILIIFDYHTAVKYLDGFVKSELICVKKYSKAYDGVDNQKKPITIIVTKDDYEKIVFQYKRLSEIGIDNFIYIDNGSTDGTIEWLKNKNNVSIYSINQKYNGTKKNGWQSKIINIFGLDRWYLILDSDEVLNYPNSENRSISHLVNFFEENDCIRPIAFLLDMHSNKLSLTKKKKLETFNYFDNNYQLSHHENGMMVKGGFRSNYFDFKDSNSPWLTKFPLFKATKNDVFRTHFSYPYYKNFSKNFLIVLQHYKFTHKDLEILEDIIREELYASKSKQYVIYKQKFDKKNFITKNIFTQKMSSSLDLLKIPLFENHMCKNWLEID